MGVASGSMVTAADGGSGSGDGDTGAAARAAGGRAAAPARGLAAPSEAVAGPAGDGDEGGRLAESEMKLWPTQNVALPIAATTRAARAACLRLPAGGDGPRPPGTTAPMSTLGGYSDGDDDRPVAPAGATAPSAASAGPPRACGPPPATS